MCFLFQHGGAKRLHGCLTQEVSFLIIGSNTVRGVTVMSAYKIRTTKTRRHHHHLHYLKKIFVCLHIRQNYLFTLLSFIQQYTTDIGASYVRTATLAQDDRECNVIAKDLYM